VCGEKMESELGMAGQVRNRRSEDNVCLKSRCVRDHEMKRVWVLPPFVAVVECMYGGGRER
jgi:hypothetical protein